MRRIFVLSLLLLATAAWAQPPGKGPVRARPPRWDERTKGAFFEKVDDALVGPRPAYGAGGGGNSAAPSPAPGVVEPAVDGTFAWSKLISPETLEDEIKDCHKALGGIVVNPQQYGGGAYLQGNLQFSTLATMFGIIAEYDGEVRWKKLASGARDTFGQAGFGSRVGSIQAFNQAKAAKATLDELVQGSSPKLPAGEAKVVFAKAVAYRPPLMKRLNIAHKDHLSPWTASANEFRGKADAVLREAEIVAALAEVIARDGYEYADNGDYQKHCQDLKAASLAAIQAVKQKNADQARQAVAAMGKSCNACHDGYRSN